MRLQRLLVLTIAGCAAAEEAFFAVRFNGKRVARSRTDPIVSPGRVSQHIHGAVGGSNFAADATGETLARSKCTSANVLEDKSSYWFPWLYFQDPVSQAFEAVNISYVVVYYFLDQTDDEIRAFPRGLQMVAGNASTRVSPDTEGERNLKPGDGFIQPVQWTCPRSGNIFSPPSWPEGSDGSTAGQGSSSNPESGTGFPHVHCDGMFSPLRADVHFPSCYNPQAALDDFHRNMAYPAFSQGSWKCPAGWLHVPRLLYEVYWDTAPFRHRWTGGQWTQPFVLSNGDVTGYSWHADFLAAWDEAVLQSLIDTTTGHLFTLESHPGVTFNGEECVCDNEPLISEPVVGPLDGLPGNRPLEGWGRTEASVGGMEP